MLELAAGPARVSVDPGRGGRIAQLRVGELELLVPDGSRPFDWGLFAMVPFAGRIGRGRFSFDGVERRLAMNLAPHAIHGTTLERRWEVVAAPADLGDGGGVGAALGIDLGSGWPFDGSVEHHIQLRPDSLTLEIEVRAVEAMPVTVGWHPWFRRDLGVGGPVQLEVAAGAMYERGPDGLPTGELLRPPPNGPWDDCFTELGAAPVLRWPGALELTVESSCSHLVVYDEPEHAVCVEPQSGPPDAVNLAEAAELAGGEVLQAQCVLRWDLAADRPGSAP